MKRLGILAAAVVVLAAAPIAHAKPVAIFYYPWYSTVEVDGRYMHWQHPSWPFQIASNFFPSRGVYSSSNLAVVRAQMAEIKAAGVHEVISSWWGWGSDEDERLPLVIQAARARGLAVSIHIEPYPGRTVGSVESDIAHLRGFGITRFYVYRPFDIPLADWATLRTRLQGVQLFAQTTEVGLAAAARFNGVYTYDILLFGANRFSRLCDQARAARLLCAPSVGPGYDASRATGDLRIKARRNGKTYDGMWRSAIAARANAVTITSYNEWGEGTQIEPARTFAEQAVGESMYESYDGAWGLHGKAAERAYLDRTLFWAKRFN
jgi:glycoprotein endo-alpha-1,2-mannosidase